KSVDEQLKELQEIAPELLEKKEVKKKELQPLKNAVKGKVVMRVAPSPSGPLHIGHAFVIGLNYAYCKMYDGKLIIRIEDTNADNIYPPAYDMIPEDANWLTNNGVDEVSIQSDRLEVYYKYAEKLIGLGKAYVCTCTSEEFKEYSDKKEACPHRESSKEENLANWKKMFSDYPEGGAVLRIKTDVKHKNPAMRDWPAARIKDFAHGEHPRQGKKYRVWPLMNFSGVVDDIESGMTHIRRGKEHADNAKKQEYVYNYLNKKIPETIFLGRINFKGMEVSCSKTRIKIEAGEYSGWDDIRLPFLRALRKRGYQPEAFVNYAKDVGPSPNDKTVTKEEFFKQVNAYNKEIVERIANRYFFVSDPVKIKIKNAPAKVCKVPKHPNDPKKGDRTFKTKDEFYITKKDFESLKEKKLYRLMDCLNFVKKGKELVFDSLEYEEYKEKGDRIMHWLPADKTVKAKVVMPDAKEVKGLAEEGIKEIKEGEVCQFERFGFVCLENKKENTFWFGHN
ncbi:glutamate--tRNA ligase, partial [Candidatus Woesearchaeota archaeon]|nr:glutamate--tRNA ligase [Candidatus Woesearchaeota archaeon]